MVTGSYRKRNMISWPNRPNRTGDGPATFTLDVRSRGVAMTYDNILETIEKKVAGQMAEKALNEILADKELQELGNALQPNEALKEELDLT